MGAIDYWCNAFAPAYRERWREAIRAQGLSLRLQGEDAFAEPDAMLARMDASGVDALLLPAADEVERAEAHAFEDHATPTALVPELAARFPGRFAGLAGIDPSLGRAGVERAAALLSQPGFVGLYLHTHSFDRAFDHRDLYPFYSLAADLDVPVVAQAGASGGLYASECGKPIGIDRPALYFANVRFVLSHTGWPWTDEAIAMASKHPNVWIGTAGWPPDHWPDALARFIAGRGRGRVLFGTSFPVVEHRRALERVAALDLTTAAREALLAGAARRVFTRL